MVVMKNFAKGAPKRFLQGEKATVTFLGRLVERKGAIHLLEAARLLHQQGQLDGVQINICGDGELRPDLEEYTQNHQLDQNVVFHGFIDEAEKGDFLASSDVAVFPSTGGEAFGIVLIEAMSTGKTVVLGGDNSGYRSVLGGKEELLFNPTQHRELADKIHHFITNTKAAKTAIDWQLEEVKQYDVNIVGKDILERYKTVIDDATKG